MATVEKMAIRLLYSTIITGVLPGLALFFLPNLMRFFPSFVREVSFDKKNDWIYRLGGIIIIVISIAFLIYHNA